MLAVVPLLPALSGAFIFDDFSNIINNPAFANPPSSLIEWWEGMLSSGSSSSGRPLAVLTLLVNVYFSGLDPFWFKLTNVILHGINGLLLYGLLAQVFVMNPMAPALGAARLDPRRVALFIAVAWTVLAVHVSAIMLVVQRMELLAHTFVLIGLMAYVHGRRRLIAGAPGRGAILLGLFALPAVGMLAKESAALTPVYAFLMELYLFRFAAATPAARKFIVLVFVAAGLTACGLAAIVVPPFLDPAVWQHRNFDLPQRLLTETRVLWTYLRWIIAPDLGSMGLYQDSYPVSTGVFHPPTTAAAIAGWAAVVALLLRLSRRPSLLGLGISWYLAAHLLTATIFPLELVFEHRNYTAAAGVLLAGLSLLLRVLQFERARRWAIPLTTLLLIAQVLVTGARSHEWGDPLRLAQADATRSPESPRAQYEYGRALWLRADNDIDSPYFTAAMAAFKRAAQLPGDPAMPLQALLIATNSTGQPVSDEWWSELTDRYRQRARTVSSGVALQNLVSCQISGLCRFPRERLLHVLMAAASQEPTDPETLSLYAHFAQSQLGDPSLALTLLQDAAELDPGNPLRWYQLGQALALAGRYSEALDAADRMDQADRWKRHHSKAVALRKLVHDVQQLAPTQPPG